MFQVGRGSPQLLTNIRISWKPVCHKHSSLFRRSVGGEENNVLYNWHLESDKNVKSAFLYTVKMPTRLSFTRKKMFWRVCVKIWFESCSTHKRKKLKSKTSSIKLSSFIPWCESLVSVFYPSLIFASKAWVFASALRVYSFIVLARKTEKKF